MKSIALLLVAFVTACQSNHLDTGERVRTMTDKRDGLLYPTVGIPGTIWLANNEYFRTSESWCYDNDPKICAEYGRLYSWEAAKKNACPAGWHLPSGADSVSMIVFNSHSKRILIDCDGNKGWALSVRCVRSIRPTS